MNGKTIGFLGGGNMAAALVKGLLHSGTVPAAKLLVSDVKKERLDHLHAAHGVRTTHDNHELARSVDVLVLSVKPQVIDKVLAEVGKDVRKETLVVSIAAGVPIEIIEARLGEGVRVVRAMPNTPATSLAGATAISGGAHATEDDLGIARALFEAVGRVVVLDETLLDAVT